MTSNGYKISSRVEENVLKLGYGDGSITPLPLLLFRYSVMSDSLQPQGLQHTRLPCLSPSPRACSNSCQLNQRCHPTIASSVVHFSSCLLQSFPASRSFPMSRLFTSGDRSIGAQASASVLPMNIWIDFPLGLTDLISLLFKGTLKSLLKHHSSKASILWHSAFFMVQLSHPYMSTGKIIALTRWTFVSKVMSPLFNMLSRFVITFLPRSKRLLISQLPSPSEVILEPKKIKSVTISIVSPSICHEMMGPDAMIFVF